MFHKGLSLIEMLVVMGILAILLGISVAGFSRATRSAERAKAQELVSNVATALSILYQREGSWPQRLARNGSGDGRLDKDAALALTSYLGLNKSADGTRLIGLDRFGIVTPWAMDAIKNASPSASANEIKVAGTSKTVEDHILHYALDLEGEGRIRNASVGGVSVNVRANAIVWCCGRDGVVSAYAGGTQSKQCDDVYSWQFGQTKDVK